MNKIIYGSIILIVLILPWNIQAQENPYLFDFPAYKRATLITEKLDRILDLSPNQEKEIFKINLKAAYKMDKLFRSSEFHDKEINYLKKIRAFKEKKYRRILSHSQYLTFESYKDNLKTEWRKKLKMNSKDVWDEKSGL